MSIFKKKPQKKRKPVPQVKKKVVQAPKERPKQWTPPFQTSGKHQQIKPVDDANAIPDKPRLLPPGPSYDISAPPPGTDAVFTENIPEEKPKETKKSEPYYHRDQEARKEFMRVFHQLTHRWRSWDIWSDFVTMTACAISNAVDQLHYEKREELYMNTVKKYSKEELDLFTDLFAHTVMALEEDPEQDFLGDIYNELGLNSKEHKQIFTPYHVAHFMAEITIGDIEEDIKRCGYVTIHDTCCGGGVTLIAAANVAKEKLAKADLNFQNHLLVTGQDIDYVVAMMCYIQMSLLGVAGYFKVGNSLTEPMSSDDSLDDYWFTPMYFFPVWHFRRIFRSLDSLFQTEQTTEQQ